MAQGGISLACTQAAPCGSLSAALEVGKPFIKVTGTIVDNAVIDNKMVTILGDPGARLASRTLDAMIKIGGASKVSIFDLKLIGPYLNEIPRESDGALTVQSGSTAVLAVERCVFTGHPNGIRAQSGNVNVSRSTFSKNYRGISSSGSGVLNVTQSTFNHNGFGVVSHDYTGSINITGSMLSHNGTGAQISGGSSTISRSLIAYNVLIGIEILSDAIRFHVANNFIIGNGSFGGIQVSPGDSNSTVEFNTIVDNRPGDGFGGITCMGKIDTPNNLIFRNGAPEGKAQVSGECSVGNSLLTAPGDPGFASASDYHLTASSPSSIINAVDCSGIEDYDGDKRPQGGKCDLGADEFRSSGM